MTAGLVFFKRLFSIETILVTRWRSEISLMRFSFLCPEPITRLAEIESRMSTLAALGYQGIELVAFRPCEYTVKQVAELSVRRHLPVVSLLSGWSHAHEGLSLASGDPIVRGKTVCRLNDYVGDAEQLRARIVVGLLQGLRSEEPDPANASERIVEGLRRVARNAQSRGVTVVLEPVNHLQVGFNHTVAEAAATVERVGSPAVGYMLDTFHMNIEERSPIEVIKTHAGRIRHFHLCETNGGHFGTGHLNFSATLLALEGGGYDGFVSVKVLRTSDWEDAARESARYLRAMGAL
jgi:sugar phosphate isomerase/epimerase